MRNTAPSITLPSDIPNIAPVVTTLNNGIKLYSVNTGTQDVAKVSLVFNAGTRYQQQKLVAGSALNLMSEGTQKYSAQEVAEKFEFLGSSYEQFLDKDYALLNVFSLTKYLNETLDILNSIVLTPTYKEAELKTYTSKRKQLLKIEQERVSYLARQEFLSTIYGEEHPYGTYANPEDYDALQRNMLAEFHKKHFTANSCFAVAAGKLSDLNIKDICSRLEQIPTGEKISGNFDYNYPIGQQHLFLKKEDAVQSAIRYGKVLVPKNHPDYAGLHILSVILGGYMGSRLMQNIREGKGYTYGIFATLVNYEFAGHLSIGTEVGAGLSKATITEISKELEMLCTTKIPHEELLMVKNYLSGEILRGLDGPWAIAEVITENIQCGFSISYAKMLFDTLQSITPERLQQLAQTYFSPDSMTSIVVGVE